MRLVTNTKIIKRNAFIGRYASLAGLAVLIGGLVFSFTLSPNEASALQFIPLITLVVGFLLSNVGILFANRWVKPPRPDEALDAALKGLDDRHTLYHYRLPAAHVLVAPSGVYALLPKRQSGTIGYENGKWHHSGVSRLLIFFGQEGLGNPLADLAAEINALTKYFEKHLPAPRVPVQGIIVFTDPGAVIQAEGAPMPTMHAKQLKEYIRRQPKGPTLIKEQIERLDTLLKITPSADSSKK